MEKPEGQVRAASEALEACKQAVKAAETEVSALTGRYWQPVSYVYRGA